MSIGKTVLAVVLGLAAFGCSESVAEVQGFENTTVKAEPNTSAEVRNGLLSVLNFYSKTTTLSDVQNVFPGSYRKLEADQVEYPFTSGFVYSHKTGLEYTVHFLDRSAAVDGYVQFALTLNAPDKVCIPLSDIYHPLLQQGWSNVLPFDNATSHGFTAVKDNLEILLRSPGGDLPHVSRSSDEPLGSNQPDYAQGCMSRFQISARK